MKCVKQISGIANQNVFSNDLAFQMMNGRSKKANPIAQ